MPPPTRLFSSRFFVMCGFTFTVFLSAFQLFPTAPFRIRDLGGSTFAAGLFLGCLTYASAFSAPLTGALADRVGQRPMLIVCSLAIAAFSIAYAVTSSVAITLALAIPHGIVWSGLLSASGAYMTNLLPPTRVAEGISYWGLSTVAAIAVAPPVGFWAYGHGWPWLCTLMVALNLAMAGIAWTLEDAGSPRRGAREARPAGPLVEWRVLVLSFTLFLFSFGYGGITSFTAVYADANGVSPKGIYLTTLALVILVTRPFAGAMADRVGHRRVLLPCLVLMSLGLALLAVQGSRAWLVLSAMIFGTGFGSAYPVFIAHVMHGVSARRRGAAFGAVLAAFDTGIGTGSGTLGWLIQRIGFAGAFGVAAVISAFALPYFLGASRWLARSTPEPEI